MPVYEYRCEACQKRSTHFFRSFALATTPDCPHCHANAGQMQKLVSKFAVLRGDEARLEALSDPSMFSDVDENDPRSVAKWARKLGEHLGDDLPGDYGEMVEQLEAGGSLADGDAGGESPMFDGGFSGGGGGFGDD